MTKNPRVEWQGRKVLRVDAERRRRIFSLKSIHEVMMANRDLDSTKELERP